MENNKKYRQQLTVIQTKIYPHVSFDEIKEFEESLAETGVKMVSGLPQILKLKVWAFGVYLISRLFNSFTIPRFGHRVFLSVGYIAPHYAAYKTFPYFTLPLGRRAIWIYDAWPQVYAEIQKFLINHEINYVFFSSSQTTFYFQNLKIPHLKVSWLPEAILIEKYKSKPYKNRKIDIIQMGRKWEEYHDKIHTFCEKNNISYIYQKKPSEIIFATREDFIEGLSNSKISICVPSSTTHPDRSGNIETMTWRYLQSMASKCVILGQMPTEMKLLFNYEPIIEIDMTRPCEQINDILVNYEKYIDLVERNYLYIKNYHQWPNRIKDMYNIIDS